MNTGKRIVFFVLLSLFVWFSEADALEALPEDHFGSLLSLREAVDRTLEHEAAVKSAVERFKKEEALYDGASAEWFPKLDAEIVQGFATGEKSSLTYLDAGVEQPLFQGGKILAERRRQKAVLELKQLMVDQVKLDVRLRMEILYTEVLTEKELIRIAQGEVKELTLASERMKKLIREEVLPRYELLRVETLLARARHAFLGHKETYDYRSAVLKEAVGIGEGEALALEPLGEVPELHQDITFYFKSARELEPVYKLKALMVEEKRFEKRTLEADRFPHMSLTAKWNSFQDIFVDTDRFVIGVTGKWNIWDFGRLEAQISAKTHELQAVRWEGEQRIREHEREIRRLFHEARALREKLRRDEALIRERQERYKNEKAKHIAGAQGDAESLEAFIGLMEAETENLHALSAYRILVAQLARKSGFGSQHKALEV